jgi:hypothetical protein
MWSKNSDGTFNVFDVPVFAKHVRKLGMKLVSDKDGNTKVAENVVNVDRAWLNKAVEINRSRLNHPEGGYIAPLHVRHHPQSADLPDTTEDAGQFILKYVRDMEYDGEKIPALFADFIRLPAAIFERIRMGKLSYRSIESLPPNFNEVDSIALLQNETPWFRLPMLTLGKEISREVYSATSSSCLRGYALAGACWSALSYFAGEEFEEKDKKPKDKEGDDKTAPPSKDGAEETGVTNIKKLDADYGADDEADIKGDEPDELGEKGDSTMGKILEVLQTIAKQNEMIIQGIGAGVKPPVPTDKDVPITEPGARSATLQSAANSDARVSALEGVVNSLKIDAEIKEKVKTTLSALAAYNLEAGLDAKLYAEARASKDPAAHLRVFEETIRKYATQLPTDGTFSGARPGLGGFIPPPGESLPEEVKPYLSQEPKNLEKALNYSQAYDDALRLGVIDKKMSRKDFVRLNMDRDYTKVFAG